MYVDMRILYADLGELQKIDEDPSFSGGYAPEVADEIRHRLQILRAARSELPLLALKALAMTPLDNGAASYRLRVKDGVGMEVQFDGNAETNARSVVINRVTSTYSDKKGEVS